MATLEIADVTKIYPGGVTAVERLDLAVHDGETLMLLGPSGCGKSTVLRMVAGLESVTGGDVRIDGKRVNDTAPKDRDVAMVFQNYALYPHLTVAQNIGLCLRAEGVRRPDVRRRVTAAARLVDLEPLLDHMPATLSGGQGQRVAIGRAIVREPKLLLMDEPLSALDAKLRVRTRAELRSLLDRLGTTTLYVTHDQSEAMSMG
ncbi:MAG: ABC transporter ATP-binding protein, partial [Acidimicrobiales bacterium]